MKELYTTCTTARKVSVEAAICKLLLWTENEYANNIINNGIGYLSAYCGNDEFSARTLKSSTIYWKWWRNLWLMRDEVFVNSVEHLSLSAKREIYSEVHNPNILVCEIYPPSVVWLEADREEIANLLTPAI